MSIGLITKFAEQLFETVKNESGMGAANVREGEFFNDSPAVGGMLQEYIAEHLPDMVGPLDVATADGIVAEEELQTLLEVAGRQGGQESLTGDEIDRAVGRILEIGLEPNGNAIRGMDRILKVVDAFEADMRVDPQILPQNSSPEVERLDDPEQSGSFIPKAFTLPMRG